MRHGKVMLLDCTLRDGGRIIDCHFQDDVIQGMTRDFVNAGMDIIEVGFLRDSNMVKYSGDSTFFTSTKQIDKFIPNKKKTAVFTVFIDYGMYDINELIPCNEQSIRGIRVGFTHNDYINDKDGLRRAFLAVKEKGYLLFVQNVNTPGYSDRELLEIVELMNEIKPYSYGIVDTYGTMYLEDMIHYYEMVDYNLRSDCCIDIHSHNNFQSSFAFAQQVIKMSSDRRNIILDATLNGMGKCAGNLNTELIADYLVRKKGFDYDVDLILDMIDRYLASYRDIEMWGYSIPAFMAGIYRAHPNNIIYLTQKYRLNSKDIKYILSAIDEEKRQRYDYDNISRVYREYNDNAIDDTECIQKLEELFENKSVLILAPGASISEEADLIMKYFDDNKPIVVGLNYIYKELPTDFFFFANTIHWERWEGKLNHDKCILTSNINKQLGKTYRVNYASLIDEDSFLYDNSMMMCLNLMKKIGVAEITMAGFDGLRKNAINYSDGVIRNRQSEYTIEQLNAEIKRMYDRFANRVSGKIKMRFLTNSLYEEDNE